jgi:hypothetical protein
MALPLLKNIALVVNPLHTKALAVAGEVAAILKSKRVEHAVFTTSWPIHWTDITEGLDNWWRWHPELFYQSLPAVQPAHGHF